MVPTINEEFTLRIWNSMLIKLRHSVLVMFVVFLFIVSVFIVHSCVHTEQWIHNFGLTQYCVSPKIGGLEYT